MLFSDEQLIQFLYSCYSKLEVTKKAIDTYYTMKTTTPEFFSNRHLDAPGLKHITDVVLVFIIMIIHSCSLELDLNMMWLFSKNGHFFHKFIILF